MIYFIMYVVDRNPISSCIAHFLAKKNMWSKIVHQAQPSQQLGRFTIRTDHKI